jgi:hypothetical protein
LNDVFLITLSNIIIKDLFVNAPYVTEISVGTYYEPDEYDATTLGLRERPVRRPQGADFIGVMGDQIQPYLIDPTKLAGALPGLRQALEICRKTFLLQARRRCPRDNWTAISSGTGTCLFGFARC